MSIYLPAHPAEFHSILPLLLPFLKIINFFPILTAFNQNLMHERERERSGVSFLPSFSIPAWELLCALWTNPSEDKVTLIHEVFYAN